MIRDLLAKIFGRIARALGFSIGENNRNRDEGIH
jgi:hypothetical protein